MKFISDDGKHVFETEQECINYENAAQRRIEIEVAEKERKERERQEEVKIINEKYKELYTLVSKFEKKHGINQSIYFVSPYELIDALCG